MLCINYTVALICSEKYVSCRSYSTSLCTGYALYFYCSNGVCYVLLIYLPHLECIFFGFFRVSNLYDKTYPGLYLTWTYYQ